VSLLHKVGRDPEVDAWLAAQPGGATVREAVAGLAGEAGRESVPARLARERGGAAEALARAVTHQAAGGDRTLSMLIGRLAVDRLWGWPMLLGVLYAVYLFVGDFGASVLVGLLEEEFFGRVLNPAVTGFVELYVGVPWLADLLVGEYGLWTMGMTYALALILPIVTTFFLAFGVLEDSGYFARLSVIANRMFAAIGLNGRAVLPMVLGLGCVTMATLTTRILHTPRERLITTFLMALAIPCSAQLGVVLGLLGGISFGATVLWTASIVAVLLATGWLASKVVRGRRVPLVTELPPLRMRDRPAAARAAARLRPLRQPRGARAAAAADDGGAVRARGARAGACRGAPRVGGDGVTALPPATIFPPAGHADCLPSPYNTCWSRAGPPPGPRMLGSSNCRTFQAGGPREGSSP